MPTRRSGDATKSAEGCIRSSDGSVLADLCQAGADRFTITALKNADGRHHHGISKIPDRTVAERQQFAVAETVCPKAQQLQTGKALLLAGMVQATADHRAWNLRSPASQCLNDNQVVIVVIRCVVQHGEQPIPCLGLVAKTSCHHQLFLSPVALQKLLDEEVLEPFDHTFLNKDVPFFATCVPTAENIALHIADRLKAPIADLGASLHKIRLQESPNNAAEIYAEPAQV